MRGSSLEAKVAFNVSEERNTFNPFASGVNNLKLLLSEL
jgi:hypothetical protein